MWRRVSPVIWLFLLIPLALELALVFWPALNSFYISLTRWRGVGVPEFIGLRNFEQLAVDPIFRTALTNNVIWVFGFGGASVVIGLALAVAAWGEEIAGLFMDQIEGPGAGGAG